MTRCERAALVFSIIAATSGCKAAVSPATSSRATVVLLPESDGRSSGRAVITNALGTVDLVDARQATDVAANKPPSPAAPLDEARVQQIFGDTLSALPLAPQTFVLRFQFDSDELTNDSRALLPEVLRTVGERPAPEVVVIGHTDTTGSKETNFQLGLKRADAVRRLLLEAGFDRSYIETASHGEANPIVPTQDDVSEPLNRRVEITVR